MLAGFREISQTEGAKSTEKKRGMIQKMLVAAKDVEAGFLVRSLQGKLRIGLAQATVLTALAHAILLQVLTRWVPEPLTLPHEPFCAVAHASLSLGGCSRVAAYAFFATTVCAGAPTVDSANRYGSKQRTARRGPTASDCVR